MSNTARDFVAGIRTFVDQAIATVKPYTATVVTAGTNTCTVQRPEEATASTQILARLAGLSVRPGDVVLCLNVGSSPMVIGRIKRVNDTTPSLTIGAAAGTGGQAVSLTSLASDSAGSIRIDTGSSGTSTGILCTFTFATPQLSNSDYVVMLTAATNAAADLNVNVTSRSTTSWVLNTRTTPATSAIVTFFYNVIPYQP